VNEKKEKHFWKSPRRNNKNNTKRESEKSNIFLYEINSKRLIFYKPAVKFIQHIDYYKNKRL